MVQQSERGSEAASVVLQRFSMEEAEHLADLLSEEHWPYHSEPTCDRASVLARVSAYDSDTAMTFWVMHNGVREGFVRIFDFDDDTPMFDLRLRQRARGRGLGTLTVRWLVDHVFQTLPSVGRIEATTRDDNEAMRRALRASGFVKEAHYRSAWHSEDGRRDSIGYAILRTDWESGTTTPVKWDG